MMLSICSTEYFVFQVWRWETEGTVWW